MTATRSTTSDGAGAQEVVETDVLIVGTGFGGLGAAIRLEQSGRHDFVVLERDHEVGGTWRDNTYPGAACDVPSHLYSFSFAPNPDWSSSFFSQPEIQDYLVGCADRFDVRRHIRFGQEVLDAVWDDDARRWTVSTTDACFSARVLVSATGALSDPKLPDLPGIDEFEGSMFHSARWNHEHDLSGERVAVIGTGASAIQFVPQIQPEVGHLTLFQRTPPWVIPRHDRSYTGLEKWMFRNLPFAQRLARTGIYWGRELYVFGFVVDTRLMGLVERLARWHIRNQIDDHELRRRVTPEYTIGCKRILISNDYYPALDQPNTEVVSDSIERFVATGVVTADGVEHGVDTVIFGTGFHTTDLPAAERITGRDGVSLANHWKDGMAAHRGTTVAGFPNLFLILGPNTGLGHSSQVFMIESQIDHTVRAIDEMDRRGATVMEPHQDAQDEWNRRVQADMEDTVWVNGGCGSWYLDEEGRNTVLWPDFTWRFRQATRRPDPDDYEMTA